MSDVTKIGASHLSRAAYVYLRQSSAAQVEHNRESTQRQYALVSKASSLGWPAQQVIVIDEDLGLSGAGIVAPLPARHGPHPTRCAGHRRAEPAQCRRGNHERRPLP